MLHIVCNRKHEVSQAKAISLKNYMFMFAHEIGEARHAFEDMSGGAAAPANIITFFDAHRKQMNQDLGINLPQPKASGLRQQAEN